MNKSRRSVWFVGLFIALGSAWARVDFAQEDPQARPGQTGANLSRATGSTADHRRFEILHQSFDSGPDVTAACLTCHTEAARQVMKTSHWTWLCPETRRQAETGGRTIGKGQHVINNFCIALGSNEPRCTSCHAGYGWEDSTFDFTVETNVDCLVCHDTTGTYKKFPTGAGHPVYEAKEWPKGSGNVWQPPNLSDIARHVGKPSRHNCGVCHFWGGGGEGVKHGDIDTTLETPDRSLDVHMAADGVDFSCTECHTTVGHQIAGRCFTIPGTTERVFVMRGIETNLLACEACHTESPHELEKINQHTDKVACQSCHVPTFARQRPTKMWWDWSQAGRRTAGGALVTEIGEVKGSAVVTYDSKKGEFIWAKDQIPEYRWFNGQVSYTFIADTVDDRTPASERAFPGTFDGGGQSHKLDPAAPLVSINSLHGSYDDPDSRIWPIKVHRGRQPYDPANQILLVAKLFGEQGSGAYWADYDWERAAEAGMSYLGLPFSGEVDFIQTEMSWPITHMVAPKEQAVKCIECHRSDGRLAALTGFYMPGRDRSPRIDALGWILVAGTVLGVASHGLLRIAAPRIRNRRMQRGD